MNFYGDMNPATNVAPCVTTERERENMRSLLKMETTRLCEALAAAERILSSIRGAFPKKDEETPVVNSMLDAERLNLSLADHINMALTEIALQMGVDE